jgi:hypothetical protein
VDEAEELKVRLENAQRRRQAKAAAGDGAGVPRPPLFFEPAAADNDDNARHVDYDDARAKADNLGATVRWRYKGTYFIQREKREWVDLGIFDTSSTASL